MISKGMSEHGILCTHCNLPVPAGCIDSSREEQFCCHGCRTVYGMLRECGLEQFYQVRAGASAEPAPARATDRRYTEFDDPTFQEIYVRRLPDGTGLVEFYLEGVHCAACVWLVERLPRVLPGVVEARLNMRRSLVTVRWDVQQAPLSRVARTLDGLGYPPHPAKDGRTRELRRREDHRFLIRIGVAAACAGNVMTLAFALYGGVFTGIEAQYSTLFRGASALFGLIALAWPGSVFLRGAWAALRTGTAHLDVPIAMGLLVGGLAGTVNVIRGQGEIYFDSLTMLVLLLLVGRWIQRRQQRWAGDAVELLFALTPNSARRVEGDQVREVPLEAVRPGDVVEVRAGDSVPTDGVVVEGASQVDQSLLTGESRPVSVRPGDPLHAATVNLSARIRVQVAAVGDATRVGRLMRLVEECSRRQAPIVQKADRLAGQFVRVLIVLAALTYGLWWWVDAPRALDRAIALLIICCPCALGLATPLAVSVALGRAASRRILIKGGETLELLAGRGTVVLDKTGTITMGRTAIVSWVGDERFQRLAAALEAHSAHPVARALVAEYADESLAIEVQAVKETGGAGIVGTVEGRRLAIGSPRFVRSQPAVVPAVLEKAERRAVNSGLTPILVAADGICVAVAGLGDPIRDDVPTALAELRHLGWNVQVLSGDDPGVVAAVGDELGISAEHRFGGMSPEEKLAYVQHAAQRDRVVMVGDGVNDAGALAAATVGVAVHGGAEASLAAADVYLNRPGLMPVVELIRAAHTTLRAVHRSLVASLGYNLLAASLVIAGWIGPLGAAILMPISSLTVLAMAFAARTFEDR